MKKSIYNIVFLLALPLLLVSCFSDLDVKQNSRITTSNMWQNEDDCFGAMYGMFDRFRSTMATAMIYWGEYRSGTFGDGLGTSTCQKMFNNSLDASEAKGTSWGSLYTTINDANLILKHTPDVSFSSEEEMNYVLANAYFIRAYCYFMIARVWGDAPLLLSGFETTHDDLQPSRTDVSEIYDQIGKDIDQAMELMPSSKTDCTVGTLDAVRMLKVDYLLWLCGTRNGTQAQLEEAGETVDEVLSGTSHGLLNEYSDVFDINNKNNKEIIFTIHFAKGEAEGGFENVYLIPVNRFYSDSSDIETHVKLMTSEDQRNNFSQKMIDLMHEDSSDTRTSVSYGEWTDVKKGITYTWVNKFAGLWQDNSRYYISDKPIYRYAEALMFKAEIELRLGNTASALEYLNMVAERAYGKSGYYSLSDAGLIKKALMKEYLKEFTVEAKSWWNYIRLGYAFTDIETLRGRQNETNILLWPISASCMSENPNIRQTVGY